MVLDVLLMLTIYLFSLLGRMNLRNAMRREKRKGKPRHDEQGKQEDPHRFVTCQYFASVAIPSDFFFHCKTFLECVNSNKK